MARGPWAFWREYVSDLKRSNAMPDDKPTPTWGVSQLMRDTLEIIQRAERERIADLWSHPPFFKIPKQDDRVDAMGYGLWLHDELYPKPHLKGTSTMSKKQITIESSTMPGPMTRVDHVARVKYGSAYATPTVTGEVKHGNSQQQAAEQLIADMEDATKQARAAFEAAGLIKPKPAPSTVATRLAERLARDLGHGAVDETSYLNVEIGGDKPNAYRAGEIGRATSIRSVFTSPNGTRVEYTRKCDEPVISTGPGSILDLLNNGRKP